MGKPKKSAKSSPTKIKRIRTHATPLCWMMPQKREGYPILHHCGFCGRVGFAHQRTHPTATVFCDASCAQLYKYFREHIAA